MSWREYVKLLKLFNTPPSIISPYPVFAVSLFLISSKGFYTSGLPILFTGIVVSLLSNYGSNLWNHCNDLKEDKAAGKKTILTQDITIKKNAQFIAVMLYAVSILLVYYLSLEFKRPIYQYFLIWALATWWYSDNLILGKVFGFRLKDHYIGELITYSVAWPAYTLSLWLIYTELNATAIILSIAFFFVSISGLLLKDIKDISGDKKAGLKTFGVMFYPSQLLRYSCYLMVLYYLVLLNPLTLKLFGMGILILLVPFVYFLKNTFLHMKSKKWIIELRDLNALKHIGISIYTSVIFMGLSSFI